MSRPTDPVIVQAIEHWSAQGQTGVSIFKLLRAHGLEVSHSAVNQIRSERHRASRAKRKSKPQLTPEITERILEAYHAGVGCLAIGSRLKFSVAGVYRVTRTAGPRRCGHARRRGPALAHDDVPPLAVRNALRHALDAACRKLAAAGGFDDDPRAGVAEPGPVLRAR